MPLRREAGAAARGASGVRPAAPASRLRACLRDGHATQTPSRRILHVYRR